MEVRMFGHFRILSTVLRASQNALVAQSRGCQRHGVQELVDCVLVRLQKPLKKHLKKLHKRKKNGTSWNKHMVGKAPRESNFCRAERHTRNKKGKNTPSFDPKDFAFHPHLPK